jgi:hypothetical protein
MSTTIPSPAEVRAKLAPMSLAKLEELATRTGVPFTTLVKLRNGQTENPRLETASADRAGSRTRKGCVSCP